MPPETKPRRGRGPKRSPALGGPKTKPRFGRGLRHPFWRCLCRGYGANGAEPRRESGAYLMLQSIRFLLCYVFNLVPGAVEVKQGPAGGL